jgi:hypothetical protein
VSAAELATSLARMEGGGPALIGLVVTLLWQISSSAKRGFGAVSRLGRRIGALEQGRREDQLRLRTVERLLRDEGVAVPRWDPPADDEDDDRREPVTEIRDRVVVPPVPGLPPHLRRNA